MSDACGCRSGASEKSIFESARSASRLSSRRCLPLMGMVKSALAGTRLSCGCRANYALEKTQSVAMPTAWDNRIAARFMPKRYTSRELVKLAQEFGWMLVGVRGDHHNFKHPASRFIVTIVHPQKDVPVGRAVDTVKKIRLDRKST